MIPIGYMAKYVHKTPDWLQAPGVIDIYSVSNCVSKDFADFINYWKHNGYWFFDSAEIIREIAQDKSIDTTDTSLFFYEAHEKEFDEGKWQSFKPDSSFATNIVLPSHKRLEGFDVVSFTGGNAPGCSPLSCNSLAKELVTNAHCLFGSFEEAEKHLDKGTFAKCEPGPYRIFAVYSADWP